MLVELFEHFDSYTKLPIKIDDIASQLVDQGCQDAITFHLVDIRNDIVRGLLHRYTVRPVVYGDPEYHSVICIAKDLSYEWKRVVAAKELLHMVDTDSFTAQSQEAVEGLLSNFAFPREMQENTNSFLNDRTHVILALGILVPLNCREIMRDLIRNGILTLEAAAGIARIPTRFIEPILNPEFEEMLKAVMNVNQSGNHIGQ